MTMIFRTDLNICFGGLVPLWEVVDGQSKINFNLN
jgi:hypothetical protein